MVLKGYCTDIWYYRVIALIYGIIRLLHWYMVLKGYCTDIWYYRAIALIYGIVGLLH